MANGYRSPSVVAMGMWFGLFGAHHQCKDVGRVHGMANGYALMWWPQRCGLAPLVPIVNTKTWGGPMMWPTGTWVCPTGASHWLVEKPCGQKGMALRLKVDTKAQGGPMT